MARRILYGNLRWLLSMTFAVGLLFYVSYFQMSQSFEYNASHVVSENAKLLNQTQELQQILNSKDLQMKHKNSLTAELRHKLNKATHDLRVKQNVNKNVQNQIQILRSELLESHKELRQTKNNLAEQSTINNNLQNRVKHLLDSNSQIQQKLSHQTQLLETAKRNFNNKMKGMLSQNVAKSKSFPHGGATCASDWDCSLGGVCDNSSSKCICDPWFTGFNCTYLNLAHAETNYGFQVPSYYSWGGRALYDKATQKYVAFFAFMANHCTLKQWTTNSEIIMTTADEPHGPYDTVNYKTIVAPWSHNPVVTQYNNQYMIWHIGNGQTNDVINCSSADTAYKSYDADANSTFYVEISNDSLYGPWTTYGENTQIVINETWDSDSSNPAPFIFPNGTTLLYFSASDCPTDWGRYNRCIAMARADHWRGPYQAVDIHAPIVHPESEDPFVFQDPRGNFHLLTNVNTGHKQCAVGVPCGGHSWSQDGVKWSQQFIGAFGPVIHLKNGTTWSNAYIERPQVFQDQVTREPITFFGGMGRSEYFDSISWAQPFCNKQLLQKGACDPTIPLT